MALPVRNPLAPIIWRGIRAIVPEREVYKWEEKIFERCTLLGYSLSDYEITVLNLSDDYERRFHPSN
jgi:hypothetical protein